MKGRSARIGGRIIGEERGGSGIGGRRRRIFDDFLNNEFKFEIEFGLVIEGGFENIKITLLIDIDEIGVGARDGGSIFDK